MNNISRIAFLIACLFMGIAIGIAIAINPPCVPGNQMHCLSEPLENSFTYCRKSGFGYTKCHAITQYPDPYYPLGIE